MEKSLLDLGSILKSQGLSALTVEVDEKADPPETLDEVGKKPQLVEMLVKGKPERVFTHAQANGISDIAVDMRKFNMAFVEIIVTGTTPSATISLEGASQKGDNYFALPGSNVSQAAVSSNTVFVAPVGTAWLKVRIASISGTFGLGLGYTITVTPFVGAGLEPVNVEIGGVPPQLDDTDKLAISLYGKGTAAGDTALDVDADGHLQVDVLSGATTGKTDDAAFTIASDAVSVLGALADESSPDSVDEGDVGAVRMTLNRVLRVIPSLHDGTTEGVDSMRGNTEGTLLASAARTANTSSADQVNYNARGVIISVNISAIADTPSITPYIRMKDPITGNSTAVALGAALTAVGFTQYVWYPTTLPTVINSVNMPLPRTWFFQMQVADTDSATYSVGYSYIL